MVQIEQNINENYLNLFRELIQKRMGIYISEQKDYLLKSKLIRLLKKSDYKNIHEFYSSVKENDNESIENLIKHITTNHTFFFRERIHLKILRNDILLRKIEKPLIWVAASSTGEEVYSIIIELSEYNIRDFLIIASDINKDVLMQIKKGEYSKEKFVHTPPEIIKKYFIKMKGERSEKYKIKDECKENIIVKQINLVDDIKFEREFNYIFCRNVLIYFDRDTQIKVVNTLLDNLDKTGYLFVGHSESLLNISNKIESVFSSVYNKKV